MSWWRGKSYPKAIPILRTPEASELARKRDEREAEEYQERKRLAKLQEERDEMTKIQQMCESTNPKLRRLGEMLLAKHFPSDDL